MIFRSRRSLVAWSTAVGLPALGLIISVGRAGTLLPVPNRFPEAANAFLYSNPVRGHIWALFAVCAFAAAVFVIVTAPRQLGKVPGDLPWIRITTFILFGSAIMLSVIGMLVLWREANTYTALTDKGYVARTSTNDIVRENWSSLHHVELVCGKTTRRSSMTRPYLYLHFSNGRSVEYLVTMLPTGTTKEDRNPRIDGLRADALARIEMLRNQMAVPLIWDSEVQQTEFRARDSSIVRCVNNFLTYFPKDYQQVLIATLTDSEMIRSETMASYRQSCRCFDR